MPQMFPMSWLFLFNLIILVYLLTSVKLFFGGTKTPIIYAGTTISLDSSSMKWMW